MYFVFIVVFLSHGVHFNDSFRVWDIVPDIATQLPGVQTTGTVCRKLSVIQTQRDPDTWRERSGADHKYREQNCHTMIKFSVNKELYILKSHIDFLYLRIRNVHDVI